MKRLFKLATVLIMLAGWPLALSAVHVVRTPGQLPVVGSMLPDWGTVHVFTKQQLGFKETFADTRTWTLEDIAARPRLVSRMIELKMDDALAGAGTADDVTAAVKGEVHAVPAMPAGTMHVVKKQELPPAGPTTQPERKSIFDNF